MRVSLTSRRCKQHVIHWEWRETECSVRRRMGSPVNWQQTGVIARHYIVFLTTADRLCISEAAVPHHLTSIYGKLAWS